MPQLVVRQGFKKRIAHRTGDEADRSEWGRLYCHQPGHRCAVSGKDDLFAALHRMYKLGQPRLGILNVDLHHI